MKIYVLWSNCEGHLGSMIGVYSSQELAQEALDEIQLLDDDPYLEIDEFELDKHATGYINELIERNQWYSS